MDWLLTAAQLVLAGVFALAGAAKLLDLAGSRRALREFGLPPRVAAVAARLLPFAELAIAVGLVLEPTARWAGLAAFVLLAGFVGGIATAMRRGEAPDCNCFGQVYSGPAGRRTLVRNALLAVLAGFVAWAGPAPAIDPWLVIAVGATVAALGVGSRALRRGSRARAGARALATALAAPREPEGLPVGARAPGFALPDLGGGTQTLEALRGRGRPVVLQFMEPSCAPCSELLPSVARWQTALSERVTIAIVTNGSVDDRTEWEEQSVADVLFDVPGDVFGAYRVHGAPRAIGVWQDGTIAASPAGGVQLPEVLIRILLRGRPELEHVA